MNEERRKEHELGQDKTVIQEFMDNPDISDFAKKLMKGTYRGWIIYGCTIITDKYPDRLGATKQTRATDDEHVITINPKTLKKSSKLTLRESRNVFDYIDRQIIREFYKNPSYWHKPIIVTRYEFAKAKRNLCREIHKSLIKIL